MFKRISQLLLLLTLLLTVLGNTVKIGVCPCHHGFFIGECECNLNTCTESKAEKSPCNCAHHAVSCDRDQPGHHNTPPASKHCDDICDNFTVEPTGDFVIESPLKAPDFDFAATASLPPQDNLHDLILSLLECESNLLPRPPPDLFEDARLAYKGFTRPELA